MCSLGNYHTPSTFSSPHLSLSSFPCACHLSSLAEAYRPVLLDHTATAGGMSLITIALIFPKSSLVPSFHPVPFLLLLECWVLVSSGGQLCSLSSCGLLLSFNSLFGHFLPLLFCMLSWHTLITGSFLPFNQPNNPRFKMNKLWILFFVDSVDL